MSYYYSFQQSPTKDIEELWDAFIDGSLLSRVDEELKKVEEEEIAAKQLPISCKATFYEDREQWIQCEKNNAYQHVVMVKKARWEAFKKNIQETEIFMRSTKDKQKMEQTAGSFMKVFMDAITSLFVPECTGYSESARDTDYLFFHQLFQKVMGIDLDATDVMPQTEQWKTFYLSLKQDLIAEAFTKFFSAENIPDKDQERTKEFCRRLLFTVRDLLRTCLKRGWDLEFTNEYWESDPSEEMAEEMTKRRIKKLIDRRMS